MMVTVACEECASVVAELRAEVLRLEEVERSHNQLVAMIRSSAAGFLAVLPAPSPYLAALADSGPDHLHDATG